MKKQNLVGLKTILVFSFTCLLLFFVQAQTDDTPPPVPMPPGTNASCGFQDNYGNWVGVSWQTPPFGSDTTGDVNFYKYNSATKKWENTGSGSGFSQRLIIYEFCAKPEYSSNMY